MTVCESDSQDTVPYFSKAVIALFAITMGQILSNDAIWIRKSNLSLREGDAMLDLIDKILLRIPFKAFLESYQSYG